MLTFLHFVCREIVKFVIQAISFRIQSSTTSAIHQYSSMITKIVIAVCLIGYTIYLGFAINYSLEDSRILIYLTALVVFCIIYVFIRDTFGDTINKYFLDPVSDWVTERWHILQWYVFKCVVGFHVLLSNIYQLIWFIN